MNQIDQQKSIPNENPEKNEITKIEKTIEAGNNFDEDFEQNCQKRDEAYIQLAKKNIGSKDRLTHIIRNSTGLILSAGADLADPSNIVDIAIPGSQFLTDFMKDYLLGRLQVGAIGLVAGKDPSGQDFYDRPEAKALGMSLPFVSPATIEAAMRVIESLTGSPLTNKTLAKVGNFFKAISRENIHEKLTKTFGKKNPSQQLS